MSRRTEYFRRGAVRIAYDIAGSGPLIVFLHGVGGNRTNWSGELDGPLASQFCCVAWDARGYGESDDPDRPLVFEDFAHDLLALLDHLGAQRAHLVGLSMGGYIAQEFYFRSPARVATLALVASSAGASLFSAEDRETFLAQRLRPLESGQTLADIAPSLVDVLAGSRAGSKERQKLRESTEALRPEPYKAAVRALVTTDFRAKLGLIAVPTLIIVGSEDRVLPQELSEYLAAHIAGSRLIVLPGVGHLCNIEAPSEFAAALTAFLGQGDLAARSSRLAIAPGRARGF